MKGFVVKYVIIIAVLSVLVHLGKGKFLTEDLGEDYASENCPEYLEENLSENTVRRSWKNYRGQDFCLTYSITDFEHEESRLDRLRYKFVGLKENFWGELYQELYASSEDRLGNLIQELDSIRVDQNMNDLQFANMVVSFVQDIPYAYVLWSESCSDKEPMLGGCISDIKYGILSPSEFLYSLKGDCDTRTVLLYKLFKHFGYDPRIAVSDVYAHAMLLLDLPGMGKYLEENGRRYYFWETTHTGWQLGMLPPDTGNTNYWEIAL